MQTLPNKTGYNPAMWDKVVDTSTMTCAIAFTVSGRKKQFAAGWEDAVDGKTPRFSNIYYQNGYQQGMKDNDEERTIN